MILLRMLQELFLAMATEEMHHLEGISRKYKDLILRII